MTKFIETLKQRTYIHGMFLRPVRTSMRRDIEAARLSEIEARLSDVEVRLTRLEPRRPSADRLALEASLASLGRAVAREELLKASRK